MRPGAGLGVGAHEVAHLGQVVGQHGQALGALVQVGEAWRQGRTDAGRAFDRVGELGRVRGADRDLFYRFLRDTFVKNDIRARVSIKSMKKRYAGI